STWSDALASSTRSKILKQAVEMLVTTARDELPDRFSRIDELGTRAILVASQSAHLTLLITKGIMKFEC
ncbi:MAG: hypothetical protein V3U87_03355, partial [Methylococcaceae bacterium]